MTDLLNTTVGHLFVCLILLCNLNGIASAETSAELYQRALVAEKSHGDLGTAQTLYRQILDRYASGKASQPLAQQAKARIAALNNNPESSILASVAPQNPDHNPRQNLGLQYLKERAAARQQLTQHQSPLEQKIATWLSLLHTNTLLDRMADPAGSIHKAEIRDPFYAWAIAIRQTLCLRSIPERMATVQNTRRKTPSLGPAELYIAGLIAEKEHHDQTGAIELYRKALNNAPATLATHIRTKLRTLNTPEGDLQ